MHSQHLIVFETASAVPTVHESIVIELLREDAEVAATSVERDNWLSGWDEADLFILNSVEFLAGKAKANSSVIFMGKERPAHVPDSWLLLPPNCAPSSFAQVSRAILQAQDRSHPRTEARIKEAFGAQTLSTWSTAAKASALLSESKGPPGWLRVAAKVLKQEIPGVTICAMVARADDNFVLNPLGGIPRPVFPLVEKEVVAGERTLLVARDLADAGATHLRENGAQILIPFPGHRNLVGWLLASFTDLVEATLGRGLLEQLAAYLQILIKQRDRVEEEAAWRLAVEAGLDEIDIGISILDKAGIPLLQNRVNREIECRLGSAIDGRLRPLHQALRLARGGKVAKASIGAFTYQVAPWGNLHNGCVLHGGPKAPGDEAFAPLGDWLSELTGKAAAAGIKVRLPEVLPDLALIDAPANVDEFVRALGGEKLAPEIHVSLACDEGSLSLRIDQEFISMGDPPLSDQVTGCALETSSLGRRFSFHLGQSDTGRVVGKAVAVA